MSVHRCSVCGSLVPPSAATCRVCGTPAAAGLVSAVLAEPAPVGRRAAAALIDQVPILLVLVLAVTFLTRGARWEWVAALAAALVWTALLWWWSAARGSGPGKRWLRLAVVTVPDGARPGVAPALARLVVRGVLCAVTLGVAGLSYRWDPDGRERTWWDRICGTRVIETGDDARDRSSAATLAARWAPVPDESEPTVPVTAVPRASWAAAAPSAGTALTVPAVPDGSSAVSTAGAQAVSAVPAPVAAPAPSPVSPTGGQPVPVGPVPVGWVPVGSAPQQFAPGTVPAIARDPARSDRADFLSRPLVGDAFHAVPSTASSWSGSGAGVGGIGAVAIGVPAGGPAGGPGDAGAGGGGRDGGGGGGGMITGVPLVSTGKPAAVVPTAASPAVVPATAPVTPSTSTPPGEPSPLTSATVPAVPAISAPGGTQDRPAVEFVWDGGSRVSISGRVLVGRDPVPGPGEEIDHLLPVGTDSVGVSKTHLEFHVGDGSGVGEVTVTDRHSTNGVRVLRPDGTAEGCRPGVPMVVEVGDVVHFGGRSLTRTR